MIVLFDPYTGKPRHPSDIASDPKGLLIVEDIAAPTMAAAKTTAQRQADLRQRRKDAGLQSLKNVWVHPDDVEAMREYAAKLARRRAKAGKA